MSEDPDKKPANDEDAVASASEGKEQTKFRFELKKPGRERHPTLDDVVGNERFKTDLQDLTASIVEPMLYGLYGLTPEATFLFFGPPGTGKTYAAEAVANTVAMSGKTVLWAPYDTGNYGTAYINMGARTVQQFFDATKSIVDRGLAEKRFLIFDEADELLGKRHNQRFNTKEDDKVLSVIMKNLQSISSAGDVSAYAFFLTNFKDAMDSASIRAGRIDAQIEFPMPDKTALRAAFEYEIRLVNERAKWAVIKRPDTQRLAEHSNGLTYADVHTLVQGTVRETVRSYMRTAFSDGDRREILKAPSITTNDIDERISKHREQHYQNNEYFGQYRAKGRVGFQLTR